MNREMPGTAALAGKRAAPARARKRLLLLIAVLLVLLTALNLPAVHRWLPVSLWRDVPPVTSLHPIVEARMKTLVTEAKAQGISIAITDGFRSSEEQEALYRKGRDGGGAIVTNARGGESYHNYGLAIDFALRAKDGRIVWDMKYDGNGNGKADWMEVVAIAKRLGFAWGGDWKDFPDYPHLQMDFGLSIRQLQWGQRPPEDLKQAEAPAPAGVRKS
ncbi:M15 family metallopeptidase [Cohnella sp. REN36]|uniref:M15 family metallopeptidase n=1 Tax=Cohnella sp. REN36 TaxID=2887347 RepID=UPI001D1362A2|nr:M15 family metallopeptidase [Cohnella sp. REN36]MCC3375061.1 M15 family metallopeptidase [Cohnella sp. REN36]